MQNYNNYNNMLNYQRNEYAFVDGIEGARAFILRPNSMMLLMDSQKAVCYKKQVDSFGKTILLEAYDLVPHIEKAPEYVSKEEFNNQIQELKAMLEKKE